MDKNKSISQMMLYSGSIGGGVGASIIYYGIDVFPHWLIVMLLIMGYINIVFGFMAIKQCEKDFDKEFKIVEIK